MQHGIHVVTFDRLIDLVRRAFPKPTIYGGDQGGDAQKIMRFVRDEAEMRRIADVVASIDITYECETASHRQAISAAYDKRVAAERALVATIK